MAIGRTNSGGSGGGLAVYIVGGTTQPTNPKENTVWVNTDTAITEWVFSATQPSTRLDGSALSGGEVWFQVSTAATAPINVLKKNGAYEYPQACYQYISGAWVAKTARTYQKGAWVDWITYLYNEGNEFTARTGGWDLLRIIMPLVTKTTFSDHINITTAQSGANAPWFVFGCNNDIDVTDFNTLTVTASGTMSDLNIGLINNARSGANPSFLAFTALGDAISPTDFTVDISSITGTHSVGISSTGNVGGRNFDMWSCRLD